ncbi:MAG: GPW/gp25 family protein [Planctomycetota bacterium]|nr:GPW/gp25 family protein [Planctomycetota bacterium]
MPHPISIIDRLTGGTPPSADTTTTVDLVARDLVLLLNSWELLPPVEHGYSDEMLSSVVNYGVPNMSGKSTRPSVLQDYRTAVRDAVARFEPRLDPETLMIDVAVLPPPVGTAEFGLLIEGELLGLDTARRISFRSRVNASTGRVVLV